MRRRLIPALAAAIALVGLAPPGLAEAKPPARAAGATVIGFSGYTPIFDTHRRGPIADIVAKLQRRGLAAEVYPPGDSDSLGEQILANPPRRGR